MKAAYDPEIISAPSILGLRPTGVEYLAESLLAAGLAENVRAVRPVVYVPTLNALYNDKREQQTNCLNPEAIRDFSVALSKVVADTVHKNRFALVLGGDCSILLGIMSALKAKGTYGLIFLDAHADFYEPEQSPTGEVADMELAIVTGRGPETLTNIEHRQPYVKDENVIHVGQRDGEETKKYGSRDIQATAIKCFDLASIEKKGLDITVAEILQHLDRLAVDGCWIHYDTDVLSDEINPAVDYRLAGGLLFEQVEQLVGSLLLTGRMTGMSVSIFNPTLDTDGRIAKRITNSMGRAFALNNL